ncbi:hypothetical protein [Chitinophaga defluvii]|uniref:SH3 domain-containing protein n=1 Tax=Chitinophaga defluvii TaxID=3163343 RepID=A0ABV2SY82_9BACT
MKQLLYLLCSMLLLIACEQNNKPGKKNKPTDNTTTQKKKTTPPPAPASPVVGERISGPANIRNTIDGDVIFSLNDYVRVNCAPASNGWYPVSIDIDITQQEYQRPILKKGRKIKMEGILVGEILQDIKIFPATNGKRMWATINGFTRINNIRTGTIIENALPLYLKQHNGNSINDIKPFIKNFKLEEDKQFTPFVQYFNYESGIEDISPLYRLVLVFHQNKLIGVVHARPLELAGTGKRKLKRDFAVNFFNGTDKKIQEDYIRKFNAFITAVD